MAFAHSQNTNIQSGTFNDVAGNQYNYYHQTTDHERWAIAAWLSDLDFKGTQKDIFANRTQGTGQWLLESQEFKDWFAGKSDVLWCPGAREILTIGSWFHDLTFVCAAGAGKTVLT
jgi:hypothetical protein